MLKILPKLKNNGDTIVEVIIAVAVLSSVIGTAYAISSRSLRIGQNTQERTEAVKYIESQAEMLRLARYKYLVNPEQNYPQWIRTFLNSDSPSVSKCVETLGDGSIAPSNSCNVGTDSKYRISITPPSAGSLEAIVIKASWVPLGRNDDQSSNSNVTLYYRIR